jgi:hypothetical protein
MDDFILKDDLIVECESCGNEMMAKISVLENDNSVICSECGVVRMLNLEELHRQLDLMRETLREMHGGAAGGDEDSKAD